MLKFEVESDRDVIVSGLGLLEAGQPVEITDEMAHFFKAIQGVELAEANFPSFVSVTAVVTEGDE